MPEPPRPGSTFEAAAVAEAYRHRPPYPPKIYQRLASLAPRRESLLDLGCGTGKIANELAGTFIRVTAVDVSAEMLKVARLADVAHEAAITWICGPAESAVIPGAPFDLVVAAASIHWMDHAVLFPRLSTLVSDDHVIAVVDGDAPVDPPWQEAWDKFLARWLPELTGARYEPGLPGNSYEVRMNRYRRWLEIAGEESYLSPPVNQTVDSFISCQHSRDSFAPSRLGKRKNSFDDELRRLLSPHAHDGVLGYRTRATITWGRIRQPDQNAISM